MSTGFNSGLSSDKAKPSGNWHAQLNKTDQTDIYRENYVLNLLHLPETLNFATSGFSRITDS